MIPDLSHLGRIKMGPGVIGRTSLVALAFLILMIAAIFATKDNSNMIMIIIIISSVMSCIYFSLSFWYANKFPDHSVMDGAELVQHAQLQQSSREKNIIDIEATPIQNTTPPKSISGSNNV